ncbi:MAG: NAD+ synthase [Candidatus Omnitrophota bacterium]|nr:NAD+ synthase [Candidatus Omnitrophota bacterium]
MDQIRFAMAQINPTVGDLTGNRDKIVKFVSDARSLGCDIVIFPELAVCGYPPEDLLFKPKFIEDSSKILHEIAHKAENITVIAGCVDKVKDDLFNAAALIRDKEIICMYHKILLPNYGVFDEKRYFKAGNESLAFKLDGLKIGVNICEDIWEGNGPASFEALNMGAPVIINISASPYCAGKLHLRESMLSSRARETASIILYNNMVGGQDELVFDGGSMILGWQGSILARGRQFEEDLVLFDLNVEEYLKHRKVPHRKIITNGFKPKEISLKKCEIKIRPPFPPRRIEKLGSIEEVYKALVLGTKDYAVKNGFKKAVLGLSGGIDSALVAAIAVDALGKDNVVGVTMPSIYTKEETRADAVIVARSLGIKVLTIPISNVFQSYLRTLRKDFSAKGVSASGGKGNVAEENIQARIRGNFLMALSNKFDWLVLTTGNKSEMSTGYCTLYGDMAGGFAVIKDVPKTVVYHLVEYRNAVANKEIIPKTIIKRAPSAELRPNQKDQDTLPPYSTLDSILKLYVEEDKSFSEIVGSHFDPRVVKKVISMVDRNEYKRRQGPPGIKITPKAFGKDRRLPITSKYTDTGNLKKKEILK